MLTNTLNNTESSIYFCSTRAVSDTKSPTTTSPADRPVDFQPL